MKKEKTTRQYRIYDEEFKKNALSLLKAGRSAFSVAESLGISTSLLYRWKKTASDQASSSVKTQNEEIKNLRKKLAEVEEERDILKKALSIFSRKI